MWLLLLILFAELLVMVEVVELVSIGWDFGVSVAGENEREKKREKTLGNDKQVVDKE